MNIQYVSLYILQIQICSIFSHRRLQSVGGYCFRLRHGGLSMIMSVWVCHIKCPDFK